ncbi:MAG: teichuronic acid exporter [Candidatus Latescibacterota bacterium]|jgi:teichuronic acid exporter
MPDEQSAIQRIARGAIQTFGSAYAARLITLAVRLLLLQILVPKDFGAVGTAFSLLAMAVAARDFGLHYALLHQHDRVHSLAPTHFILSISLGSISTVLALLMAVYYDQAIALTQTLTVYLGGTATESYPKVALALAIFGILDFFRTAALTAEVQLQRDLEFGRLALAHAGGTILAALVGLTLAYLGFGKWALILGFYPYSVAYVVVFCAVVWSKHPPPLKHLHQFNADAARQMIRYGFQFWLGGVPKIFVQHYDKLIISFFIGLNWRGLYDTAQDFAQIPTGAITLAIVRITGAVYARYQNDREQLSAAYRRALRLILRATVPLSLLLALEADRWVLIFRGEWMAAAPLLQSLIIYSLCRPILDDLHALFYSVGSPLSIARFAVIQALILLILAPFLALDIDGYGLGLGIYGIALSMNVMAFVGLILALTFARQFVDIPITKTFAPPLIAGLIGVALHQGIAPYLLTLSPLIHFILGSLLFSTGYIFGLFLIERKTIMLEIQNILQAVKPTPPTP